MRIHLSVLSAFPSGAPLGPVLPGSALGSRHSRTSAWRLPVRLLLSLANGRSQQDAGGQKESEVGSYSFPPCVGALRSPLLKSSQVLLGGPSM